MVCCKVKFNLVNKSYYFMANPVHVLGKFPCSDWFFLGQDFAVRSDVCIFVLERGRQIQHLQPKQ